MKDFYHCSHVDTFGEKTLTDLLFPLLNFTFLKSRFTKNEGFLPLFSRGHFWVKNEVFWWKKTLIDLLFPLLNFTFLRGRFTKSKGHFDQRKPKEIGKNGANIRIFWRYHRRKKKCRFHGFPSIKTDSCVAGCSNYHHNIPPWKNTARVKILVKNFLRRIKNFFS